VKDIASQSTGDKFCYLSNMLSVDGDADAALETRIRIGWNKFRQLVPVLTNKDISLIVRGRLYSSEVYEVECARPRGRPKKTWREIVVKDCQACKLNKDAVDRKRWRKQIRDD